MLLLHFTNPYASGLLVLALLPPEGAGALHTVLAR